MKIGILGGSFDPIHQGHLYMAYQARIQAGLDEVWLIPNGNAPHKKASDMADATHRLTMCRLAVLESAYDFLKVSDIEVVSEEYSYTYKTMQQVRSLYPEHEFYFIMGADSLDYFEKWRHPEIISSLCHILVINRDVFTVSDIESKIEAINRLFPAEITHISCKKYDISSTEIRKGQGWDMLCDSVRNYITEHKLYGQGEYSVSG